MSNISSRTNTHIAQNVIAGAIGGLAASYVMNQFQALWTKTAEALTVQKSEPQEGGGDDATVKTANAISRTVLQHELEPDEKKWAGPVVHYAFGTLLGATYGFLAETVPTVKAGTGVAYGGAVWLAADEIAVPAFKLSGPPLETPAPAHIKALASHLVFGATTELTRRLIMFASNRLRHA